MNFFSLYHYCRFTGMSRRASMRHAYRLRMR
jgi:hypothetical protein